MLKTIRSRLVAASVAIVVGAIAVTTGGSYLAVSADARDRAQERLAELGRAHGAAIAAWVQTRKDIVSAMGPGATDDDPRPMLAQALASGGLDLAYVGGADKRMVSIPDRQRAADYDPTGRSWYRLADTTDAAVVTPPYIAASSKKLVVTFARAVKDGGRTVAVTGGDVRLDDVIATLKSIKPTPGGFAMLLDGGGNVIAHPDAALTLKPVADLSAALDAGLLARTQGDELVAADIGGREFFLKSTPIAGTDWRLVTAADSGEALAAVADLLRSAAVSLVALAVVAALAAAAMVGVTLRGLTRVRDAMDRIGNGRGDLSQRLPADGGDEIADVARSFNQFVGQIEQVVADVRQSSQSIAVASRQIAAGSQDLSTRTERTAGSLQSTASSMEELTTTVRHTADAAGAADDLARRTSDVAQRGSAAVAQVVATMQDIQQSSRRIGDIIGTIDGIAFQTNILALNAAVEAARAGEQGRGFAVVASEVRALAKRSADAAKEIKSLITASVEQVEGGTQRVADAGATMDAVLDSVRQVGRIIGEISTAAGEQSAGLVQVNTAVGELDQITQQNASLVEESTAAAESLQEQAQRLAEVVGSFRLSATA